MHALHELIQQLKEKGQRLVLANPSRRVQAQLQRVNLLTEIGQEWIFVRTADAVKMCGLAVREKAPHAAGAHIEEGELSSVSVDEVHVHTNGLAQLSRPGKHAETSSSNSDGLVDIAQSDSPRATEGNASAGGSARSAHDGAAHAALNTHGSADFETPRDAPPPPPGDTS